MERTELILSAMQMGLLDGPRPMPSGDEFRDLAAGNGLLPVNSAMLAGFFSVFHENFPDAPEWASEPSLVEFLGMAGLHDIPAGPEANDYFIGRWAAGDLAGLRELIRRAKHRDGSPASIGAGNDAINVLDAAGAASPQLLAKLRANGYVVPLTFGNHPVGSVTAFKLPVAPGSAVPARAHGHAPAAQNRPRPVVPPLAASAPIAAPAVVPVDARSRGGARLGVVNADLVAGAIYVGTNRLTVAEANKLSDDLTIAARALVLPMEGYAWVDDMRDPTRLTTLICLDDVLAGPVARLDGALPGLVHNLDLGGFVRAVVLQNEADKFTFNLWLRDGSSRISEVYEAQDLAQVAVAAKVRELAAAAPSPAESL